jgi:hypothetical protein
MAFIKVALQKSGKLKILKVVRLQPGDVLRSYDECFKILKPVNPTDLRSPSRYVGPGPCPPTFPK